MGMLSFIFGKTTSIKVVQDQEFPEYLKRIGAYDDVVSGRHYCVSCGTQISLDNLQAITPGKNGNVRFICDKPSCLKPIND
jgi:hypothetical protein